MLSLGAGAERVAGDLWGTFQLLALDVTPADDVRADAIDILPLLRQRGRLDGSAGPSIEVAWAQGRTLRWPAAGRSVLGFQRLESWWVEASLAGLGPGGYAYLR